MDLAKLKADVAFEMFAASAALLLLPRRRHRARKGRTSPKARRNLEEIVDYTSAKDGTGVKLLWGTANLFTNRRYMSGAATNPDPDVFAYSAATVKPASTPPTSSGRRELRAVGRPRRL
jgi:xylose isomerase